MLKIGSPLTRLNSGRIEDLCGQLRGFKLVSFVEGSDPWPFRLTDVQSPTAGIIQQIVRWNNSVDQTQLMGFFSFNWLRELVKMSKKLMCNIIGMKEGILRNERSKWAYHHHFKCFCQSNKAGKALCSWNVGPVPNTSYKLQYHDSSSSY